MIHAKQYNYGINAIRLFFNNLISWLPAMGYLVNSVALSVFNEYCSSWPLSAGFGPDADTTIRLLRGNGNLRFPKSTSIAVICRGN